MPARHRSRQRAVQILFQADMRRQPIADAIRNFYDSLYTSEFEEDAPGDVQAPRPALDEFMETLVRGTHDRLPSIDQQITLHSAHWRIERMPSVDRNILQLAIYEMLMQETPPPVVIDEALELGREFSSPESVSFINGILDAVRRGDASENPGT